MDPMITAAVVVEGYREGESYLILLTKKLTLQLLETAIGIIG